jgi:hypothetical protein
MPITARLVPRWPAWWPCLACAMPIDLGPACDALRALPWPVGPWRGEYRPACAWRAHALAQTHGYLVAGTGNKSEILVGYYTKYGDGGVDVEPPGSLYKGGRQLARERRATSVIERPPTAGSGRPTRPRWA